MFDVRLVQLIRLDPVYSLIWVYQYEENHANAHALLRKLFWHMFRLDFLVFLF
jgi:hypothetical protein